MFAQGVVLARLLYLSVTLSTLDRATAWALASGGPRQRFPTIAAAASRARSPSLPDPAASARPPPSFHQLPPGTPLQQHCSHRRLNTQPLAAEAIHSAVWPGSVHRVPFVLLLLLLLLLLLPSSVAAVAAHTSPSTFSTQPLDLLHHHLPLMAADCTELLYPCRQTLVQAMDPQTRSAWRLVNTRACLDVYESTRSLTWGAPQHGLNISAGSAPAPNTLPLPLLSKCPCLQKLQCGGMTSLLSLDAMPHALQLEVLDLGRTGIRRCLDFSPLTRCCTPEGRRTLKELHLGNNQLGAGGSAALAPALNALTGLRHLDLQGNELGPVGAEMLAPALRALTGLHHLALGGNRLGPVGAAMLAPALQALTGLQQLNLSSNGLGAHGVAALAPAVQALTGLQRLDLAGNSLGPAGAVALTPALQKLAGLQQLNLWSNDLDAHGVAVLLPTLQALPGRSVLLPTLQALPGRSVTGLQHLDLRGDNQLGPEGAAALVHVLQEHNPQLHISTR